MRYLIGILAIVLFLGLAGGSFYFSYINPNIPMLLLGVAISVGILIVLYVAKKRRNRF